MVVEWIEVAGIVLEVERPGDPESLLDEEAFADDEYMPYWAELWPSGIGLAGHVAALPLAALSVLELGCGLGVPSLVAAARGARVVATDWSADAIALLEANAGRNGVTVTALVADWRVPQAGRFDLVLAADVLYEGRNVIPVVAAIETALAEHGQALVADPGRRHLDEFVELAGRTLSVEVVAGDWTSSARLVRLRRPAAP